MKATQLRYLAEVNPETPEFAALAGDTDITFMPLETVWADDRRDVTRLVKKADVSTGYVRFREGDVLCPKVTPTFQAGRSTHIESLPHGVGAATTEVHVVRARPGRADPRFLKYRLLAKDFLEEGEANFQGVAGLQRVPENFLLCLPVVPCSLEDQRRIADFLDDQVARIDATRSLVTTQRNLLAEHQKSLITAAVTGQLDLDTGELLTQVPSVSVVGGPTEAWQASLPEEWSWVKLKYVATIGTGHTPDRNEPQYWINCEIPWVTAADLSSRTSAFEPLMDTHQKVSELGIANSAAVVHPAETVMFCRTASVGLFCITGKEMATTQAFVTWSAGPALKPRYLLYVISALRPEFDRLAYGSTHLTIYMPDLEALAVPLPPLGVQMKLVEFLDGQLGRLTDADDALTSSLDLLDEYKRSLITAAVTGELDVTTARPGVSA